MSAEMLQQASNAAPNLHKWLTIPVIAALTSAPPPLSGEEPSRHIGNCTPQIVMLRHHPTHLNIRQPHYVMESSLGDGASNH
eukprot:1004756-Amphidinium_carterae.1